MFGLFKKKKKEEDVDSIFHGIIMKIRKYIDTNEDTSAMLLVNTKKSGYCFIQGGVMSLHASLSKAMEGDPGFADVLRNVVRENDNLEDIPKGLRDLINQAKKQDPGNVQEFKLPGGGTALSIDPNKVDNLSDEEIDKIIKGLMDTHEDDEDKSER